MPRPLAIVPVLVAAALAAAAPGAAAQSPLASVKLVDCSPDKASATFYARMRPTDDGTRMFVRLRLLERHGEGYQSLDAPGLSRWHRSKAGVGAFGFRQTVRGLRPGALYRMQATFRWENAYGQTVERIRMRSGACRQFDATPNLASALAGAEATTVPGVLRYLVRVSNSGAAAAENVELALAVDGSVVDTVTVPSLAAGQERVVAITGPECASKVESVADPDGVIVESSEADNRHELACAGLPRS
jgi:hypothetical protein